MIVTFELRKIPDEGTGTPVDTLVKVSKKDALPAEEETWCNVQELNALFNTCCERWGDNWDLNKVMTAIRECEFD